MKLHMDLMTKVRLVCQSVLINKLTFSFFVKNITRGNSPLGEYRIYCSLLSFSVFPKFVCTGRQYDKDGNLKQWWRDSTIQAFRKEAQCMIDQYSNYTLEQIGLNVRHPYLY